MRAVSLIIIALAPVEGVAEAQKDRRCDVSYCMMDAAAQAIDIPPLRESGNVSSENELRVWVSRGREPNLLFRVTKQRGEVVAQFVAFDVSIGNDLPGLHCDVIGFDVGITVLDSHVVPVIERGPILHQLLVNGAWTLASSERKVALDNSLSLILERRHKGRYSIDSHDNPKIMDGSDEIAACEIIRVLDRYATKVGLSFKADSCDLQSGGLDPNWLNLPPHPATARGGGVR